LNDFKERPLESDMAVNVVKKHAAQLDTKRCSGLQWFGMPFLNSGGVTHVTPGSLSAAEPILAMRL
jgi:hypothetical protein